MKSSADKSMKTVMMQVDEIKPSPDNPRDNSKAIDAVAESIREFGFKVPCIVDEEGILITGHTRLEAAKKLGLEKIPVIIAADLDEEEKRQFRLADNKIGELSTWDIEKAEKEMAEIKDFDMGKFGFSEYLCSIQSGTEDDLVKAQDKQKSDEIDEKNIKCPRCHAIFSKEVARI